MKITVQLFIVIVIFLLIGVASSVSAQTRGVRPDQTKRASQGEQIRGSSDKVRSLIDRMFVRLENQLDNYEEFLTRVKSRRNKLSEIGKDVVKIDVFILTASDNLAKARTTAAAAKTILEDIDTTANKRVAMVTIREQHSSVRRAMTTLHASMKQAVAELKATDSGPLEEGDEE